MLTVNADLLICILQLAYFSHVTAVPSRRDSREGPSFTNQPPSIVEFTNSTGTLVTCSARGNPTPVIRWIKPDGNDVTRIQGLRHILSNGTLYYPPFSASSYHQDVHSSTVRCLASNSLGAIISAAVRLTAVVKQYYEVKVYDEFVIRGNTAVIRCHIPSFVKDYVIVTGWIKNSALRSPLEIGSGGRYSVFPSGELHIRSVGTLDDFTSYRCKTHHRLTGETRVSDTHGRLVVTDPQNTFPPRITDSRSVMEGWLQENIELPCAAQGLPIPKYRWYKVERTTLIPLVIGQRLQQLGGSLVINGLGADDAGKYVCVIENNVGEERAETRLVVSGQLIANIQPPKQTVDVGKTAIFNCTVTGFPVHNISWYFNGHPIITNNRRILTAWNVLRIEAVSSNDEGMYQCFATNAHSSGQASAQLKLGDVTPKFLETFQEQTYKPGPSVALKCIAGGSPKPEISWTLDGMQVRRAGRVIVGDYVTSNGFVVSHVNISSVRVEDGGMYRCTASNGAGHIHHEAKLIVFGLPLVRPLENLTAVSMETIFVHCRVAGHPIDSIHWEKEGRRLPFNHRQKVYGNGTLEITHVDAVGDGGTYSCIARNEQGQSSQGKMTLNVRVPPLIEQFDFAKTLHEGMRTRVYCNIARGDPPITVTWKKDGEPIDDSLGVIVKDVDTYSVALAIEKLSTKHNGNYTCVAGNEAATVNVTAQLVVNVLPHWIIEPVNSFVIQGNTVMLNCKAEGFPPPQIVWKQAPGKTASNFRQILSGPHYQVFENGTLRITDAAKEDAGYYLCQATNGIGAGLSTVVFLTVHVPAHFEKQPTNKTVGVSQEARLSCRAFGDKPMTIIWNRNGQAIDVKSKTRFKLREEVTSDGMISEVRIPSVQRGDSALYSCLVTNAFGHDETQVRLVVQERPEPPRNVEVIDKSSRHVTVSWKTPFDGSSPILRYIVFYKNSSNPWQSDTVNVTVPGDQTTVIIRNLNPASTYDFRLCAESLIGRSDPSDSKSVTSAEEIPGGPPTDVVVRPVSSQSLEVTWEPPESRLQYGTIKGYYVGYKVYNSSEPYLYKTLEVKEKFRNRCIVDNLRKFSKYSVLVQAFNAMGAGPRSDEVVAATMEDVPSLPPRHVQCTAISSQSLYLRWLPPPVSSLHGILTGYRVVYKPLEDDDADAGKLEKDVITSNVKINLETLGKFTNYSIQLMARTRAGSGVASGPIFCRTKEDVPDRPAGIKALVMAVDAVLISWLPPLRPNGILREYTVYCRGYSLGRHNTTKVTLPPSILSYEARKLKRGQRNEFWVTSSTSVGEGDPSSIVTQSTSQRAPARISSFSSRLVGKWRREVQLPCRAVGLPTPTRHWKVRGSELLETDRVRVLPTGSLKISNLQGTDAGNYSCHVTNLYGTDEIYHHLLVEVSKETQTVPPAPIPHIESVTSSSVTISWKSFPEATITGYELHYKGTNIDWEHLQLASNYTIYTLRDLACGTRHHIYVVSMNGESRSEPSNIISAKTEGGVPVPPTKEAFVVENSTSVTLNLDSWGNGGCPIKSMTIEYRSPLLSSDWTLVTKDIQPKQGPLTLQDLQSSTRYIIRVTAYNRVDSTVAEYEALTLDDSGGTIIPELIVRTDEPSPFTDTAVLVPLISSLVVLAAVLVTLLILCHRRSVTEAKYEDHSIKNDLSEANQEKKQNRDSANRPLPTVFSSPVRKVAPFSDSFTKNIDSCDDISPYATFQTPLSDARLWQAIDRSRRTGGCERREVKETGLFSISAQKLNCDSRREENQGIAVLGMDMPPVNRGFQLSKKTKGHLISKRSIKSPRIKETVGESGEERTYAFSTSPSTEICHYEPTIDQDTARHKDRHAKNK